MAKELLNILEAITERPFIVIGGKPYKLRLMDELSIRDRVALKLAVAAFQKAANPDVTLDEAGAADDALADLLRVILLDPLPREVDAALTRLQKEVIAAAFFGEMKLMADEKAKEAESRTSG